MDRATLEVAVKHLIDAHNILHAVESDKDAFIKASVIAMRYIVPASVIIFSIDFPCRGNGVLRSAIAIDDAMDCMCDVATKDRNSLLNMLCAVSELRIAVINFANGIGMNVDYVQSLLHLKIAT